MSGRNESSQGGEGRVFRGASTAFPDYMDPQLSYTGEGWTAMYNTYIPLLTYRHADGREGSEVVPGLARELPEISADGQTYTLFLRPGLRYSDGQPVRASDFEFAVARMFALRSGGCHFFEDIVGIDVDDETGRIAIRLRRPRTTFSNELALIFTAPVPPDTPLRNLTSNPPPGTGPYVITSSRPPHFWTYGRNPVWDGNNGRLLPQIPRGHVDRARIRINLDLQTQVREIEEGELDWMYDPPPADRFGEIEARYGGTQFRREPTVSTYYFWMNTRLAPFDDLRVRQAVNHAVDRAALRRIYCGQMETSHQILPARVPGHRPFDLYPHDMERARQLVAEADPTRRDVTVWTDRKWPDSAAGAYYADVLKDLGFEVHLKSLDTYTYFRVLGNPSTPDLHTGFSNWFEDYPHPNAIFQPLLASRPQEVNSTNFSQLQVPSLNREVADLGRDSGPIDEDRYAALDREYMKLAPIVPYGARVRSVFVSEAIALNEVIWNPTFDVDLTSFRFERSPTSPRGEKAVVGR